MKNTKALLDAHKEVGPEVNTKNIMYYVQGLSSENRITIQR